MFDVRAWYKSENLTGACANFFPQAPVDAGMLPEYEALAGLLDREPEWERDAAALRLRMLSILSSIAEGFVQSGKACIRAHAKELCKSGKCNTDWKA